VAALDKEAYQLSLNKKELKSTVNSNLLKLCYDRIDYELTIIVEHKNNKKML